MPASSAVISLWLRERMERTEFVLYADQQAVEFDRELPRRQVRGVIGKRGDLAVHLDRRAHVVHGGAGVGAIRVVRLDLIAPDVGLERPDGPGERIADAPEPHPVER